MEAVSPLPKSGAVFFDPRDERRSLRVSFHDDTGLFVLSLWFDGNCIGTFRLSAEQAPALVQAFVEPLAQRVEPAEEQSTG
jgi:hypothetical protein